ncbi:MAG: aldo/keto reductase [Candidatus Latescibacteria bacterium]|jgi:1-deoxyxylulose-5-phosphate synthase|nr:aldo/keto reductase [Candidatus Latescibacterota bacterium]
METKTFRGMKCRRMGDSGLWVSEVGLGTWKWGDPSYDGSRVGDHDGFNILDRALELGIFHWDTASSYNMGSGNSERLLGRYFACRGSRARGQVVLATKVSNPARDEHEVEREFFPNESGSSRKYIMQAVDGCLKRLQTDRVDILYIHQPALMDDGSWATPLDETWAAMDDLVSAGKVLYLAVSNRTTSQIDEEIAALGSVASNPSRRIIAVQNWYNLAERVKVATEGKDRAEGDEQTFLNHVAQLNIGLVPFFPLASGLLTGRYHKGNFDASGRIVQDGGTWKDMFLTERNLNLVEELDRIAGKKKCSMAQLAIAWLLSHDVIPSVIAGVTKMEQLEDNAGAPLVEITKEELKEIDRISK